MKTALWHPMLAAHPKDTGDGINAACDRAIQQIPKPVLGSIKYDGIRCSIQNGVLYTRSLKPIRNLELQDKWGFAELNGLDCEITVGCPWAPDVFNQTTRVVMSTNADAKDAVLRVIDKVNGDASLGFNLRRTSMVKAVLRYHNLNIEPVEQVQLNTIREINRFEKETVLKGYEGIMLRGQFDVYKHGRSTIKEGGLVAIKRFVDAEAIVLDTYEQMENQNEKQINELGRSKRSMSQEGMVGKGTLGGFTVALLRVGFKPTLAQVQHILMAGANNSTVFNIGTGVGLTAAYRAELWAKRRTLKGKIIKMRYQAVGTIDAPRLPIFLGFRDKEDM